MERVGVFSRWVDSKWQSQFWSPSSPRIPGLVISPLPSTVSFSKPTGDGPAQICSVINGIRTGKKCQKGCFCGKWQSDSESRMWLFKGVRIGEDISGSFSCVVRLKYKVCLALTGVAQLGVPSHALKGHRFDSGSEHMPRLWMWSPIRLYMRGNLDWYFSHICFYLPPFPFLSL